MKAVAALILMALLAAPAAACEMCRDATPAVTAASPQASAGLEFNNSIYFMLASIAVAGGFVGRTMLRAVKPLDGFSAPTDDRTVA